MAIKARWQRQRGQ